jgi:hypothetical protein
MRFLTRLMLLAIALAIGAAAGFAQDAKSKPDAPAPTPADPPAPAVEYNPNNWKEYSSPTGGFSVMFPGTSVEETDAGSGKLKGRKYTVATTAAYVVSYLDFPSDVAENLETNAALYNEIFDVMRDGALEPRGGKLISETEISLESHPGRLFKLSIADGTVTRVKLYLVGNRFYQLLVVTPQELSAPDGGKFDQTRTTKFLDSFKFAKRSAVEEKPDAWKTFSSADGRFTVLFPGTPTATDNSYTVTTSVAYAVSFTDFAVDLEKDPKEFDRAFNSMRDYANAAGKAKVLDETASSIAGFKGRMLRVAAPDEKATTLKAFAVGKRFYLIIVTTPAVSQTTDGGRANELLATKFFDSFKVSRQE